MENRLQKILDEQGRKYSWLADAVGVHRNTITNLIKGAEPKLSLAYKITRALDKKTVYEIWPDIE